MIQISAGRGPAECCWVVAQVLKLLIKEAERKGFSYEILFRQEGQENGTLNSVLVQISGKAVKDFLSNWQGTIQWIGKSPFRKFHKRKNWFVGLSALDQKAGVKLNESDLEFNAFRSSGPGGQHRNKEETAVRATHKPTGLSVTASDSKSQLQNKKNAIKKMQEAFEQNDLKVIQEQMNEQWKEHLSLV